MATLPSIPARDTSRYAGQYGSTDDAGTLFQVLRDAIDVALTSAVEDTARARYDLAIECYHRALELPLPTEIREQLRGVVESMVARFPTAWRVNFALAEVELAGSVARAEIQREHLERARATLAEGLEQGDVDAAELGDLLSQVEEHLARRVAPEAVTEAVTEAALVMPSAQGDRAGRGGGAARAADLASLEALAEEVAVIDVEAESKDERPHVTLELSVLPRVHLAMHAAGDPPVYALRAAVDGGADGRVAELRGLTLEFSADPPLFAPVQVQVERLAPDAPLELGSRHLERLLAMDSGLLRSLTERAEGSVAARLLDARGDEIASTRADWTLFPVDSWIGARTLPDLLAAFVLPNDPVIETVLSAAAVHLARATDSPDIDGYQSKDPARALRIVEAVYRALRDAEVTYANPPTSFETDGQRVRFPSAIHSSRLATCLDMALFAAAALERCGLYPTIVLVQGHAFVGVWLIERTFANAALEEPLRFSKRVELAEIVVFDPTLATSRPSPDFAGAREAAERYLEDRDAFQLVIDVHRARLGGVLPLPMPGEPLPDSGGPSSGIPQSSAGATRSTRDLDAELRVLLEAERRRREVDETPESRLDRWLRQLLDLTMRNRLLNSGASSKRVLPLLGANLAAVEDRLADGKSFKVVERPKELAASDATEGESLVRLLPLLAESLGSGRLHSTLTPSELEERLLTLFREARTAREEGGANSLYLAIGFLRYFETKDSAKERRAPLLLVPLELKRQSARRGYSLVHGGDEPRVNVTLLEYLRRDHQIDVVGLDPLPTDDKGVDVALLLRVFKEAIKDEDRWEVVEAAEVGLYSFSKYLLWRDLKDRADVLRRSDLVAHLIDRPGEAFPQDAEIPDPRTLDDEFGAADVFAPMSYDSSQLAAILAAANGKTLVLEGPPGTGKSQTITNLVAHAIAGGKTVLFVSEKMAALDVVHRRLRSLGLGPACLELHSNKASKKGVLEQFKESLDEGRVRGQKRRKWDEIAADVERTRRRLNDHVEALHRPRTSGDSVHGVVARSGAVREAPSGELDLGIADPRTVGEAELRRMRAALDEIDVVARRELVGPDHPLLRVGRSDYSPLVEEETRAELSAFDAPAGEFRAAAVDALGAVGLAADSAAAPHDEAGWRALVALTRIAGAARDLGPGAEQALAATNGFAPASEALDRLDELQRLREGFEARFRVSPATLDLAALETARREMASGGWFVRWRRKGVLVKAFRGIAVDPGRVRIDDAQRALTEAQRVVELEALVQATAERDLAVLGPSVGSVARGAATDLAAARAALERALELAGAARRLAESSGCDVGLVVRALAAETPPGEEPPRAAEAGISAALSAGLDGLLSARAGLVRAAAPLEAVPQDLSLTSLEALQALARVWIDGWRGLRGWCRWQQARREALDAGLSSVVSAVESGALVPGATRSAFDASFERAWALHEISSDDSLRAFDGIEHERVLEGFGALDDERLGAAREEVRQRVGQKRPNPSAMMSASEAGPRSAAAKSGLGLLQRELTKKTRHLAIRRLLGELGEVAMELKPCFLMSPMSVAQYLDADHPAFDIVVFDEASQIPVWDAIGAIARGRQAVIVGDPKQLPPTSFFSRGEDDSTAEDDLQDLESILDECIAARVPTHRLTWHYRSRHESLIAFSNERYYDSGLLTFPSGSSKGLGVSLELVTDGVYDKGRTRTNAVEARRVVDEVVARLRDPAHADRTIGVVTFSQAQQTLMLDLLEVELREHPELEPFFDDAQTESVFVKNLENVQGDERDVIIFSIGYGPDERGRVSMNFGPLNKDGGERRLNVAVTRARQEVLVFTSLRSDQIDLARTNARGVRDLRAFLRHAERSTARAAGAAVYEAAEASSAPASDPLVESLASALRARGWHVETEVGESDVTLDLAVRSPDDPGEYLLGIETDGANYSRAATARDRDRLRPEVLAGLGWELTRVWTIDWWRDPAAEIERLDGLLRAARERGRPTDEPGTGIVPAG